MPQFLELTRLHAWGRLGRKIELGEKTGKEPLGRFCSRVSVECNSNNIDNETAYLIIYCLNCIRCDGNSTY